jgi:hypothetical protein
MIPVGSWPVDRITIVGFGVYDKITWSFVGHSAGYRKKMAPFVRHLITGHARGRPGSGGPAQQPRRAAVPRRCRCAGPGYGTMGASGSTTLSGFRVGAALRGPWRHGTWQGGKS